MHNYLKKLEELVAEGKVPKCGLHMLQIEHDDWCRALNGKGDCNCDPNRSLKPNLTQDQWVAAMMGQGERKDD